jgi:hypothetical protein
LVSFRRLVLASAFLVPMLALSSGARALEPDEVPLSSLSNSSTQKESRALKPNPHKKPHGNPAAGIPNIDSVVNFSGRFKADGVDSTGVPQTWWYYNMLGTDPKHGGTTTINAPIVPVSLDLVRPDGSKLHVDATRNVQNVLGSPIFSKAEFSSSNVPTQFSDAVHRAQFGQTAKADWHTLLAPAVKPERTMTLPFGSYRFARNPDGSVAFVLVNINFFANRLFPATATDTTTPVGAAENAGDITTKDLSTFLFANTFLTFDDGSCCVIGFHSYDFEPGDATNGNTEKRFVLNYSSWVTPGLFGDSFADVTAISHEISESYSDPFVASDNLHNIVPWWLAPNGLCQNNLEDGDVIEGLPNDTYPMTMNGFTYHPQNEALLPWFAREQYSSAIDGAYSYPNEDVLTALSPPQKANCAP